MGHLYDTRKNAIPHKVEKGDTLTSIAAKYKGKADVPADLDWRELALFNWATIEDAQVTRALCERFGSDVPGAVHAGGAPADLALDPAFGPSSPEPVLVPKLWKAKALAVNKQHTVKALNRTAAAAIDITSLDKWFIPEHETCDIDYNTVGDPDFAGAVQFEVFASNYGKLKAWNNGLPTFDPLPGVPVYSADAAGGEVRGWTGLSKCAQGALSPSGRSLTVAFSPYTAVLRFAGKGTHLDARIDLEPFWVLFDDGGKPIPDSCKIKWTVQNADLPLGLLQIADREGTIVFAKGLNSADLKKNLYDWNGKTSAGDDAVPGQMPYRVQLQAHTGIDTPDALALAAMQTEVRLFVHHLTHPAAKSDYDPLTDQTSLDFSIAPVYHKDKPLERSDGSLWTKFKLAEAGFHPGPVTDAAENDHFKSARHEFQRSVPIGGGGGVPPFVRMALGDDNKDTKDALEGLQASRKRPWFGKPAETGAVIGFDWRPGNWLDPAAGDFLARLRDPQKRMIAWVDDRNWYTDGEYWFDGWYDGSPLVSRANLNTINADPAALGGNSKITGRGSFEDREDRIRCDARDIARPWVPLQVEFRLLSKAEGLTSIPAIPDAPLAAIMRKAIGPLRVDWTFDEIEKTSTVAGVKENGANVTHALPELDWESDAMFSNLYHPPAVRVSLPRPTATRTRMALRWALDNLKTEHDRKDVKRKSCYYNAPLRYGGIRPVDPNAYFQEPFGHGASSLAPWTATPDASRQSICTAVHDNVGQASEEVCKKRLGRAGIYFHPSRIAGDGYQIRGQVRFDTSGPYVPPNAAILAARYSRLPQAHTVQFRLWRKTSIRGFVPWAPAENWSLVGPSGFPHLPKTGPDEWRSQYTACHISIENELGAADGVLKMLPTALFPVADDYYDLIADILDAGDKRKNPLNRGWMTLSDDFVWPWSGHENYGVTTPAPSLDFQTGKGELFKQLNSDHVNIAIRMSLALVKAIEAQTGRMRGHVMVQYQTTANCFFYQYKCTGCAATPVYVQNSDRGVMGGKPCPFPPCGGVLRSNLVQWAFYQCPSFHQASFQEVRPGGGEHQNQKCQHCAGLLNLRRAQSYPVSRSHSNTMGTNAINGVPSPSCGFPVGVFWNFAGDGSLWAHELGHNRHYEHAADAPGKGDCRDQHDNIANALITHGTEDPKNTGWDRTCLMSYISSVLDTTGTSSYGNERDLACFCFKCVLRNRGWNLVALPVPQGDLQDVAGV